MAYSAVEFLRDNLKELLIHRSDLIGLARNDVEQLRDQLDVLKGALTRNFDVKYLKRVNEAVYDVEDLIDSFTTAKRSTNNLRKLFFHRSTRLDVKPFMEGTLKPLIEEVMNVPNLTILGENEGEGSDYNYTMLNEAFRRTDRVVGLEDELEILVRRIIQEEYDGVDVIPITGMPGIGKTTMAWRIYRDPSIQYEFPVNIWITVSQDLNIRNVCLTISKNFTSLDLSSQDDRELVSMVNEYLQASKFIIFFDDVWSSEAWDQIKSLLPMRNNKNSKVVITTRNLDVGAKFGGNNHNLRFLKPTESWELLQLRVFDSVDVCPKDLVTVGKDIASACSGLPLSIVIIGGLLLDCIRSERSENKVKSKWKTISMNVSDHMFNDDRTFRANNPISWSYVSMPPDLKDCFLYLGVFPEDAEIPVWKLTQLWIAEGFIRHYGQRSLEETAKQVLNDLINRNLLVVNRTNVHGEVKTCRIHDIIREFCRREAFAVGLFQEIIRSERGEFEPPILDLYSSRRLCIHSYVSNFFAQKPVFKKARSFLCFPSATYNLMRKDVPAFLAAFSTVRVWDTNNLKFPVFPNKLTELFHLRYITLSIGEASSLPEAISNLWNLRTLVVDTHSRTLTIKADIWKLMHLRHLKTHASILLKDGKGEETTDLQTLTRLSPECLTPVLKKAKKLNKLGIRGRLSGSMCFAEMHSLETLKLRHDVHSGVQSEMPMDMLPMPYDFPPTIRCLVLSDTYLEWKHMSMLRQISTLEVLKLKNNAFTGSNWEVDSGSFENLVAFSIDRANLKNWIASSNSFNKLKTLKLKNCEQLVQIPQNLEKTLELLLLERVTRYAVYCAEEMVQMRAASGNGRFQLQIAPADWI